MVVKVLLKPKDSYIFLLVIIFSKKTISLSVRLNGLGSEHYTCDRFCSELV